MPVDALLKTMLDLNKDPTVEKLLKILSKKITNEAFADFLETERRTRSIVISGIEQGSDDMRPSERQTDLGNKHIDHHIQIKMKMENLLAFLLILSLLVTNL
ncbi:hypothetical protein OESDEN_20786 [Oesophagostomum dentatum]|uniref:Uncharacterized protein n=1 Tax=Oesophagostomum dentatum TaxID=61180 RepID=A0A0B1S7T3_OESDE|nr:hypothetical protein OESDEN_20786 [Oesophagostomum dentatum]